MTTYSVTFLYTNAVITTAVDGDHAIVPRARAQLEQLLGANLPEPIELSVFEHPEEDHASPQM